MKKKILVICTKGENRSRYLAKYLRSKGYNAKFGGVSSEAKKLLNQKNIDWADIVIIVRKHIGKKLKKRFKFDDKKIIQLEVRDNPKRFSKVAQKLADKNWFAFQEKYVYSNLRKQISKYMPFK